MPDEPGDFCHKLAGWEIVHSDDDFVGLAEGGPWTGFQRADGYRAPERPEQKVPQHFHLDFGAPNLDEAEEKALALGATKAAVQLSVGRLRRGFVRLSVSWHRIPQGSTRCPRHRTGHVAKRRTSPLRPRLRTTCRVRTLQDHRRWPEVGLPRLLTPTVRKNGTGLFCGASGSRNVAGKSPASCLDR
ncbi:VOC family protein [Streptomyces sp. NPDC048527]|uniref:VOC family protein n=1 Tax=Streptomyces sp. NPDC048527 TaxID=3365568 RepID=UPI003714538E